MHNLLRKSVVHRSHHESREQPSGLLTLILLTICLEYIYQLIHCLHSAIRGADAKMKRNRARADAKEYLDGFRKSQNNLSDSDNLLFFSNTLKSVPRGDYIETIHQEWYGKYDILEQHHGYIQWLFPIR